VFEDLAVSNSVSRQRLDEAAEPHNVHDFGKSDQLLKFRARDDDGAFALARHPPQQRMDLSLGAHVDTLGRLIYEEYPRVGFEGAGERDLC
jgi:hypothetical protein